MISYRIIKLGRNKKRMICYTAPIVPAPEFERRGPALIAKDSIYNRLVWVSVRKNRVWVHFYGKGWVIYEFGLKVNGKVLRELSRRHTKNAVIIEYSNGWRRFIKFGRTSFRDYFQLNKRPREPLEIRVLRRFLRKDFSFKKPWVVVNGKRRTLQDDLLTIYPIDDPPYIIDPSGSYPASSEDSYMWQHGATAAEAREATEAFDQDEGYSYLEVYWRYDDSSIVPEEERYRCGRAWLIFDTTAIPSNATITSVALNIYAVNTAGIFYFYGSATAPHIPLRKDDYNIANWGDFLKSDFIEEGWNTVDLPTQAVSAGGFTKIGVRIEADVKGPDQADQAVLIASADDPDNPPYLIVEYTANTPPSEPTSLETNNQTNPHLVNTNPEFSAVYNDPDSGDVTRNAEVQIATDSDFANIIWDSGKVSISDTTTGSRCPNIPYTGNPLATGTYYWRIKFWDDDDTEGAWSTETAYFVIATTVNQTLSSTARISGTKSVLTQSHACLFDVMHSTLTSAARLQGRSYVALASSADVRGSRAAILSSSSKIIIFEYRSIGSSYALVMHNIIGSAASIKRGFPGLGVDCLGSKICSNASESRYSILKSTGKVISTDCFEIVSNAKLFDTGSSAISGFARLQAQIASILSACARLRAGLYKSLQSHAHIYAHLSASAHSHARLFGYVHLILSSDSCVGGATGEQLPSNARIYGTKALARCSRARVRARLSQGISTGSRIWSFVSQQIKSSARLKDFKSLEIDSSSRLRGYVEVSLNTTTRIRGSRKTLITSTARLFCNRQTYIPAGSRIQGVANTEISSYSRIKDTIHIALNTAARIKGTAANSLLAVANIDAPELCKQLGNTQFGSGPIERYGILASNVSLTFKDIELLSSNARLSSTRLFVLSSNSKLTSVNSQTLSSSARISTTRFVVIQSAYSLGPTECHQSLASNAVLYPGIHIASAARLVGTREIALTSSGSISPGRQIATHGTARIKADIHTTVPSSTRIAGTTTTTLHSAAVITGPRTAALESVARLESNISIVSTASVIGYGEKLASRAVVMSELRYGIPLGTRFECPKYWCKQLRSDAKMSGVAVIRLKSHATIGIERRQFIGSDARVKAPDSVRISSEIRLRGYRSAFLESAALLTDSLYNHIQSSAYLWDYAMSYDVEEAVSFEVWYSEDSD